MNTKQQIADQIILVLKTLDIQRGEFAKLMEVQPSVVTR